MPSADELAHRFLAAARDLQQGASETIFLPVTIFAVGLSPLRALVTYLKNVERFSFKKMAAALHRSYPTIYAAYSETLPDIPQTEFYVPLTAFAEGLSVLEAVVAYLKERKELNLSEIGRLLGKDPRTIWATYDHAKKKRGDSRG